MLVLSYTRTEVTTGTKEESLQVSPRPVELPWALGLWLFNLQVPSSVGLFVTAGHSSSRQLGLAVT